MVSQRIFPAVSRLCHMLGAISRPFGHRFKRFLLRIWWCGLRDGVGRLLCVSLSSFYDLFLLRLIFREYRHQIFRHRSVELEVLREFHEIIELDCFVLRDPLTAMIGDLHLLEVGKISERIQKVCFHIRGSRIARYRAFSRVRWTTTACSSLLDRHRSLASIF